MKNIRDLSLQEISKYLVSISEPAYRADQIFMWLYRKRVSSFAEMTNLPSALLENLENNFRISLPEINKKQISKIDDTVKYLLQLSDGELVETVIIIAESRLTICLSTQVGCKYKCKFCASGLYGFKRNLTQAEILSQLIIAQKDGYKINNIVFMGIGEPLDNYDNVISSIKIINDKNGFNIGARKITISTAGIADKIKELANLGLQIELSISLHAADNKKRDMLMPVNKLYPLEKLMEAAGGYYQKTKRLITFEYIIIKDVNDSSGDALKVANLLAEVRCKVNLIPYSPVEEIPYKGPEKKSVLKFKEILDEAGVSATIRFSKGLDISAACGQLRIKEYKKFPYLVKDTPVSRDVIPKDPPIYL